MKISAYSHILDSSIPIEAYFEFIAQAAKLAAEHGSSLLILPGNSLGINGISHFNIFELKRRFQAISTENHLSIICEIDHTYLFYPQTTSMPLKFIQKFAVSEDEKDKYVLFANEWNNGDRFGDVSGKTVGLMLCGENNYVTNKQSDGNRALFRYPDLGWSDDYDILVNPAHTLMGNWGKHHKRFAYLSQEGRTVVHVAGDDAVHHPAKSSLCIYQDGRCILQGDFRGHDPSMIVQDNNWWMATVETLR